MIYWYNFILLQKVPKLYLNRDTVGTTRDAFYAIIETHHFFQDTIDGCLPDDILPVILVTSFWFASFGLGWWRNTLLYHTMNQNWKISLQDWKDFFVFFKLKALSPICCVINKKYRVMKIWWLPGNGCFTHNVHKNSPQILYFCK